MPNNNSGRLVKIAEFDEPQVYVFIVHPDHIPSFTQSRQIMIVDDVAFQPVRIRHEDPLYPLRSPSQEVQSLDREAQEKEGEES